MFLHPYLKGRHTVVSSYCYRIASGREICQQFLRPEMLFKILIKNVSHDRARDAYHLAKKLGNSWSKVSWKLAIFWKIHLQIVDFL